MNYQISEPSIGPVSSRVLLVDDDARILAATQRILQNSGSRVDACSSGAAALTLLRTQTFDVMVSDVQMPGMTGLGLLRAVRDHDLELPVILVTGAPGVKGAADAIEYGAFRYLIKPVTGALLTEAVARATAVARVARSRREFIDEFGSGNFRVADRAGADAVLDRAIASLWMAYQPIVHASNFSLFAFEALLRVEEPLLPHPGAVLAAAERAVRVHDVGRAVRASVVESARQAPEGLPLFVNLHPADLLDETLYDPRNPFTALAPRLVLEITERASLDHVPQLGTKIDALRALGFRIALDDLGAGYSGLTSFAQLEPEFVKLDMSLIRDIDQNPTKQKVVASMVGLCRDLGKRIVAEGIERREERDALVALGCDLLQGYLFGRPARPFPNTLPQE